MLFKLSTLALVALLGVQAHAQITAADIVKDIENINEVYIDAIDYLASPSPDSVDFNRRMGSFSDLIIAECASVIADSQNVHLSLSDKASIARALTKTERFKLYFEIMKEAVKAIDDTPSVECIAKVKAALKI
ncbi:hypothetical protein H0G86_009966 [Trichoderma simmonsii]|uniref:Uncharacterized protein n=1 Tax=Trichoderma simmonsii TaxID=1491479 RepID=A0A8G0LJ38_9HYPO|nr:hypothetical protein H0G86_009966 [Trichoderma simmonsii]